MNIFIFLITFVIGIHVYAEVTPCEKDLTRVSTLAEVITSEEKISILTTLKDNEEHIPSNATYRYAQIITRIKELESKPSN